jgi:hypothetical protein
MLISSFFEAFKAGKSLADSVTWKNRAILGNVLVSFFSAIVAIARGVGYDVQIDDPTLQAFAGGIVAFVGISNAVLHVVTSDKVGLPSVSEGGGDAGS